tara:strand:- start:410 stop:781 length:372 start_codon:yes stop_codon:yes gene_type:complete
MIFGIIYSIKILEDNILYFFSPTQINQKNNIDYTKKIRIGGMVKKGSISIEGDEIKFVVTDYENEIIVSYSGTVPNLFSEDKGVVAEGNLKDKNFFIAKRIVAKHDENYMPPEIKESLKENVK